MSSFIIRGGNLISGAFKPTGNKNAVLPMLAASLLTDEKVVLRNVPRIEDVEVMLELLADLGVEVNRRGRTVSLEARNVKPRKLKADLCRRVRGSILLAGPLAARHGRADLPPPGGDVIGRRRVDTHFQALQALGIEVEDGPTFRFRRGQLRAATMLLDEASVTATENAMMAAALAPGETIIYNAACEPHVADLGRLLLKMGAVVVGLGTNRIMLQGVERLRGATHAVAPDHIEVASFMAAAAVTGGRLTVEGPGTPDVCAITGRAFDKLGATWSCSEEQLSIDGRKALTVQADVGGTIPKLEDGAWPAFPSDLMSVAIVMATQAGGSILFFEKMFESRMYFVDHLISMGANIVQCDPHRVLVTGPRPLQAARLSSPDIRAGIALVLAALCAEGESVIANAEVVDRGYEKIDRRLRALGASIRRSKS